jgi:hypothetical protein
MEESKITDGLWYEPQKSPYVSNFVRQKSKKIRAKLRDRGILPPYGAPLNEEQLQIIRDMYEGNFSLWDSIVIEERKNRKINGLCKTPEKSKTYDGTNSVKQNLYRLRLLEILPQTDKEYTDEHQSIIDDVTTNSIQTTKNFFKRKYYHLSTKRGRLFYRVKYNSHNHKVGITLDDIIPVDVCPYLGIKLSYEYEDRNSDNYATIDRIDPSKGYIKGNIEVVSLKSNRMKNKTTELELLQFSISAMELLKENEL